MEPVVPVPAAERGALRIAERVVAKLAAEAAREAVAAASKAPPPVPRRRGGGTHATAVVRRQPADDDAGVGQASIQVAVELRYPSDIGAQCGAVRRHVTLRLRELAGMDTSHVAVAVERLHAVDGDGRAIGDGGAGRAGRVR